MSVRSYTDHLTRPPKARLEILEQEPPAATGIDYLNLMAETHHEELRRDTRIGYDTLFADTDTVADTTDGEIEGQLSIDDIDDDRIDVAEPTEESA